MDLFSNYMCTCLGVLNLIVFYTLFIVNLCFKFLTFML